MTRDVKPRPSSRGDGSTRARLIDAAQRLFWSQGYEATSLAQILEEADARGGSLYHYFKTKTDIVIAVLDRYVEQLEPVLIQPIADQTNDPMERVMALLNGYRELLERTNFEMGCPIGALALELSDADDDVRAGIQANFDAWKRAVAGWLSGVAFVPGIEPHDVAGFVLTVMEGAVMQSQAARDLAPFDASIAQLRRYFDSIRA